MREVEQSVLKSADLLHKSGHIGLYAGGGFAVGMDGRRIRLPTYAFERETRLNLCQSQRRPLWRLDILSLP